MRRIACLLLALLILLPGCSRPQKDSCLFYYLRSTDSIRYGAEDALIAPVVRDISVRDAGLNHLLQLYLEGPTEEGFRSPIPGGITLLDTLWKGDTLVLVLSHEFSTLDNMALTLSGACLTATCHDLTGAEQIEVRSADTIYRFDLNNYAFLDGSTGQ